MMLPSVVSDLIQAYAQDMNILSELQKLHVTKRIIQSIDDTLKVEVMNVILTGVPPTMTSTTEVMIDILERVENNISRSLAGWVMEKIHHMEEQRLIIWKHEIKTPVWDRDWESAELFPFLRKFESHFRYYQLRARYEDEINRQREEAMFQDHLEYNAQGE